MRTLLIVFHSMTGGTRQMAEAAAPGGASEPAVRVRLLRPPGGAARGRAHGGRLHLRHPREPRGHGQAHEGLFFDRTYYAALRRIEGRSSAPAATAATPRARTSASAPAGGCGRSPIRSSCARIPRCPRPFWRPKLSAPMTWAAAKSSAAHPRGVVGHGHLLKRPPSVLAQSAAAIPQRRLQRRSAPSAPAAAGAGTAPSARRGGSAGRRSSATAAPSLRGSEAP